MKIPNGMSALVFSNAYYKVLDSETVFSFFKELADKNLFTMDESNQAKHQLSGAFLMEYPKGHWNPFARMPGAKQVIGGAKMEEGVLKIDAKSKENLKMLRMAVEKITGDAIEFDREEFEDALEALRRK